MGESIELDADVDVDNVTVVCRGDQATIAFGPGADRATLTGHCHQLHDLIIEAERQLTLLNRGIFDRHS